MAPVAREICDEWVPTRWVGCTEEHPETQHLWMSLAQREIWKSPAVLLPEIANDQMEKVMTVCLYTSSARMELVDL